MDNHYVIERIMKNLAFELEPGPLKENSSDGGPLSVKIKIRNRQAKAAAPEMILKKVRLVNSDETLMSFDILMEKDYRQITPRKTRKNTGNFFGKLKPGLCIKQIDDNDYVYLPSSNINYDDPETKDGCEPDELRKQQVKLSDKDMDTSARTGTMKKEKTFLGTKCKAGGCLDPSFDEDRYSYGPNLKDFVDQYLKGPPKVKLEDLETKLNETNEKKTNNKSKDKPLLIKPVDDDISVSKKESLQISLITYPTYDEHNKEINYRNNENRPSITDSINVIFNPPKGFKRNSNLQQPSSKNKTDSTDDVIQKNKEYFRESELQSQQQKDSMANVKLGPNTHIDYIETIGSSHTSYSTSEENNLYRTEVSGKEQNGIKQGKISKDDTFSNCESGNRLSKELKVYKHSGSELNYQYSQPIKDIDTYAINGKTKKEKSFLGSKCKPGGCLDPSYDEDKYTYRPSTQVLSKQGSEIATAKQKKSDVNITPEISANRTCDESDHTPAFIKPCDDNNVKPGKINETRNEIDSIKNSSLACTSKNVLNTEEAEKTALRNNSYENNLQYSNNNSINSFIKPCQEFEEDFNNYKQQSSCGLVITKNDKVEHPKSSMSSLSTFSSSKQKGPETNINNDIQTPSGKMLLEQKSVSENIESEGISEFLTNSERLNSNTDLNSVYIDYTKTTDTLASTTDTVNKKEIADSVIHVGSLNIPSEKNSTSSTIHNTLENSDQLYNHVSQNTTTSNDDVEPKTTKSCDVYSNTTTDLKINNDESPSPSNIYKTESPISTLAISDIECQAEGNWKSEDNVSLKYEQITLNQFEPSLNESENTLDSPSKEIEQKSNLLQTSPDYNSESAAKTKLTKTSLSLLNLSASSEQNFSISTIQSVYTKSDNGSRQSIHTVEIIEHKEIFKTTSVTEDPPQSLEVYITTDENVSLIKDVQKDTKEYFLIADTTDMIDETDGAENCEDYIDQFEANQRNGSHVFNKTEEEIEDENQLSSQLLMNQATIKNAKNFEYKEKNLLDSNDSVIENKAAKLSDNNIRDNFAKSSDYNTINDNAANEIIDNKSYSMVNGNKELQYHNHNAHKIHLSQDDNIIKTASYIRETEIKVSKNNALFSRTSIIDQKDINGRKDQSKDKELLLNKDPVKYDNIHKNDKSYHSDDKILALDREYADFNDYHHIPPTSDDKEVLTDLHKNKHKNIEQSEPTLIATEDSSSVKLNDTIILDLTFHSYTNEKNQRIIRTVKNEKEIERHPKDSTFVLKSQLILSLKNSKQKISIPLGSDVGVIINVENISEEESCKPATESISALDQISTKKEINKAQDGKMIVHGKTNARNQVNSTLTHIYEQDLMPLQTMIRNLKYEIEELEKQQMLLNKQPLSVKQPNLQRNKSFNKKLDSKNVNFCTCRST